MKFCEDCDIERNINKSQFGLNKTFCSRWINCQFLGTKKYKFSCLLTDPNENLVKMRIQSKSFTSEWGWFLLLWENLWLIMSNVLEWHYLISLLIFRIFKVTSTFWNQVECLSCSVMVSYGQFSFKQLWSQRCCIQV